MLTWTRSEIRALVRKLVSMPGTSGLSNDEIDNRINNYYQNIFPDDARVAELETSFELTTSVYDPGGYELSALMHTIREPMTIEDSDGNISDVTFYTDQAKFFALYPQDVTSRGRPVAALLYGRVLYLGKADATYTFKTSAVKKPAALSSDSSVPLDVRWGKPIAYGAAILIKEENRDIESVEKLSVVYDSLLTLINRRDLIQKTTNARAKPRC